MKDSKNKNKNKNNIKKISLKSSPLKVQVKRNNIKKRRNDNSKKLIGIVTGLIVGLAILIAFLAINAVDTPLKVSNKFVDDIQCRKSVAAYNLMSAEAQNITKKPDFDLIIRRIAPVLTGTPTIISREISKDKDQNKIAKVVYEIMGTDATYIVTVMLQEVNGKWQISSFESKTKE